MPLRFCIFFLLFLCCGHALAAQTIKGEVVDMDTKQPVEGVDIRNIYTGFGILSGEDGTFFIAAANDQLLEFSKTGYQTVRVRIPLGFIPPYFKIIIQKGLPDIPLLDERTAHTYRGDSLRFTELYKHELEFPRLSTLESIEHPFSALSAQNREIWAFQDDFKQEQEQKYIDYTFNDSLVSRLTGLTGNDLRYYMRRYRPSYRQLRAMKEYELYEYIRVTGRRYHLDQGGGGRTTR